MAIRPLIGVLAALVLASSATVAVAAETHAAKPTPLELNYVDGSQKCVNGNPSAFLKTEGGKGKWVVVSTRTYENGDRASQPTPYDETKVERLTQLPLTNLSGAETVQWEAFLVDRKGNESDHVWSDLLDCS